MAIIAHGIDLIEISRVAAVLEAHGPRFTDRCFTPRERTYAEAGRRFRAERYAARFAAKEAVLKALGTGWSNGISWRDIEVRRRPSGEPGLELSGRCAEIARGRGICRWHVSLSHTRASAVASVIACGDAA